MKRSLRKLLFVFLFLAIQLGYGQNEFFFNHYLFNPTYFNPAWAGVEEQAFAAVHHRTQWAGYDATFDPEGAPTTQMLSAVVPVEGKLAGFGLTIVNDRTGPLTSIQARIAITTSFTLRQGKVFLGLMPSLNVASLDANFRPADNQPDPFIPSGNESQYRPNLHAGLVFQSKKEYFVGISVENILQPGFSFGTEAENNIEPNHNLFFTKFLRIARDFILKPSLLVRSDLNSYSLDLTGVLEYQEKMWGGLAFRRAESVSVLLGYSFLKGNKLKAGYSFDYVVQERDAKEPTSHEVFVRYNLPDLILGGRKAVKTPRFTF
ncbi:MAG: PorP/SprF family type IX secretion system membrane protein [Bacteroidota bacterium]